MNIPHYRPESQFTEASNALKLKQLYRERDYAGLLELALLLNHQAAFNHSRMMYFMQEAATQPMPVSEEHEKMAAESRKKLNDQKQ
jgi:hypothetical protein